MPVRLYHKVGIIDIQLYHERLPHVESHRILLREVRA